MVYYSGNDSGNDCTTTMLTFSEIHQKIFNQLSIEDLPKELEPLLKSIRCCHNEYLVYIICSLKGDFTHWGPISYLKFRTKVGYFSYFDLCFKTHHDSPWKDS